MNTDIFPIVDSNMIHEYFNMANIPLTSVNKYRGNLTQIEGICNGSIPFHITLNSNDQILIKAGNLVRCINISHV